MEFHLHGEEYIVVVLEKQTIPALYLRSVYWVMDRMQDLGNGVFASQQIP